MTDDINVTDTNLQEHSEEGEILQNANVQGALDLQLSKGKMKNILD